MRHYLEDGATITGKVIWLKHGAALHITEGIVLMPHEPETAAADYRGPIDAQAIPRDPHEVGQTAMIVPHHTSAISERFWL